MKLSLTAALASVAIFFVSESVACGCINLGRVPDYDCQRDILSCAWVEEKEDPGVCDYINSNLLYGSDKEFQRCIS